MPKPTLLSLFCGAGGLDLGFEQAGFRVALGIDKNAEAIASYNHNRSKNRGRVADVSKLTLARLDAMLGGPQAFDGIIGGPPCQSFSKANHFRGKDDPRHALPSAFARLIARVHERSPLSFVVMENVPDLATGQYRRRLSGSLLTLERAGFTLFEKVLSSADFGVPQRRERLFVVGLNPELISPDKFSWPDPTTTTPLTVRQTIGKLPEPRYFERGLSSSEIAFHPNHWCMQPKSAKFATPGALKPGRSSQRSFKTLQWDAPSLTVAYGHREVHIHPGCHRRLSVFEAMRLQGFPDDYELVGTLSAQITQVSEAVPPPLAEAVARAVALAKIQDAQPHVRLRKAG